MSNNDIVYIRNNNRYGGSRSFVGKTPPVAKNYITAKSRFSDTFFNIGQLYYTQTAALRDAYYAKVSELRREYNAKLLKELKQTPETPISHQSGEKDILSEYLKLITPFVVERSKEIAKAKASNPKKWWTPKWLYFGDLCGTCGAIKQGKNCPLYLEH